MTIIVLIFKKLIPINYSNTFSIIIYIALISIIGSTIYFLISYKTGLLQNILGQEFITKIKAKFTHKKRSN